MTRISKIANAIKERRVLRSIGKKMLLGGQKKRRFIQSLGLNVIPSNFYSNVPSLEEIDQSFEYTSAEPPYADSGIFSMENMLSELLELSKCTESFDPPHSGDEENCQSYFWDNSQFSGADAMAYYAFIRKTRPSRVVEIGSGFSSLVALEAIKVNGYGKLTCIEPYPRPFISDLSDRGEIELLKDKAQSITHSELNSMLSDGDILFIDSTHTVKTGSDCLHIYLRLLPKITKRILVHAHDIFLPFGLPKEWLEERHIYWTEQYLLLALLIDNPRAEVLFGSSYHAHYNRDLLERFMCGRSQASGASLWFSYDGSQSHSERLKAPSIS